MSDIAIEMVPALFWTGLMSVPLYFIIPRAGKSRWLLLVAVVPMIGALALLWYLAFSRWPQDVPVR